MNKDEFEKWYAENNGTTVEVLRKLGRIILPCRCDEAADCKGWVSVHKDGALDHLKFYGPDCAFCLEYAVAKGSAFIDGTRDIEHIKLIFLCQRHYDALETVSFGDSRYHMIDGISEWGSGLTWLCDPPDAEKPTNAAGSPV